MEQKQLTPALTVGPQISKADLATLARDGFTDVVCNRPDAEHDGPGSILMAAEAKALGLGFHYLPITPGAPIEDEARALLRLTARPGSKVFAYCRSGARAEAAFAAARPAH